MTILLAALLVSSQPANPGNSTAPAAKKPAQICEMMEVTGSRSKKRVCRDAGGNLDLGPGVSHNVGKAKVEQSPAAGAPGGS